jgi:hypothetical protein
MAHLQGFMDFWDCCNSLNVVVVVFFFCKNLPKGDTIFLNGIFYCNFFIKNHLKATNVFCELVMFTSYSPKSSLR